MKALLVLLASAALPACDAATKPPTNNTPRTVELPKACRTYDAAKGGVQFTCVFYDQKVNNDSVGIEDEWIILQTTGVTNTTGWTINAGDKNQTFPLPASINASLTVYTVAVPATVTTPAMALGRAKGSWVWNNTTPDTARIYDAQGALVDEFAYLGK